MEWSKYLTDERWRTLVSVLMSALMFDGSHPGCISGYVPTPVAWEIEADVHDRNGIVICCTDRSRKIRALTLHP